MINSFYRYKKIYLIRSTGNEAYGMHTKKFSIQVEKLAVQCSKTSSAEIL